MRQGAVGSVRIVRHGDRSLIEKSFSDPIRHRTELLALRALANSELPVPELVEIDSDSILMSLMPGERLDSADADLRLERLRASTTLLRRLHDRQAPRGLPPAPDDALLIRRYRDAGGPPLPLVIPPASGSVFCHGDWTDGNLLAVGGTITAVVDWEAAHAGDPPRAFTSGVGCGTEGPAVVRRHRRGIRRRSHNRACLVCHSRCRTLALVL